MGNGRDGWVGSGNLGICFCAIELESDPKRKKKGRGKGSKGRKTDEEGSVRSVLCSVRSKARSYVRSVLAPFVAMPFVPFVANLVPSASHLSQVRVLAINPVLLPACCMPLSAPNGPMVTRHPSVAGS